MAQRLFAFILIVAALIIAAVNAYKSWTERPAGEGTCYVQSRFVIPDACRGDCGDKEICRPLTTRDYLLGFLQQPDECVCVKKGKSPGSMGETGSGVTGTVVPPPM
ncbi:MAG: hypothetical protein HY809_03500 [Nitrospirae bacterium]|nr:hypothetical protein [Nitrospirota bacterium]